VRVLLAALLLLASPATRITPPEDLPQRGLRLVKPAVVRIESHATATVSAAVIDFDEPALTAFARSDVDRLLRSRQFFPSVDAAELQVRLDLEREFVANPGAYLRLGERVSDPYEATRVGSGWLADASGSVVTAADVVLDEAAVTAGATEEERAAVAAALDDVSPADMGLTVPLTDAQKANIVNAAVAKVVPSIQVSGIASTTKVQLGLALPGEKTGIGVFPDVKVAATKPAAHGMGLAVLSVPLPRTVSVPLAFGSALTAGQPIVIAGYPAAKAESVGVSSGGLVGPEAVSGTVGEAEPEGGAATDAGFTAGVVGGVALDADGQAIGVAVKRDGSSAIVSIAEVTRALEQAQPPVSRMSTNPDKTTKTYRDAADAMSRHWYRRALPRLEDVRRKAPRAPWVADQVDEARQQIKLGHDESPSDRPIAPVAVAAVLFAIDAVAVTTVLRRRLLRRQRVATG